MDVSSLASIGIGIQAASLQQNVALTVLKQAAQEEQALVQMIASASGLGQNLDISV